MFTSFQSSLRRRLAAGYTAIMSTVAPKTRFKSVPSSPEGSSTSLDELDGLLKDSPTSFDLAAAEIPPLGEPRQEKWFWWQRQDNYDQNAIATQVRSLNDATWIVAKAV